jgi:predicted nuclease of predicted toxin-antitoxin system
VRLPEPYTFFVDRCLGTCDVCTELRSAGANVVMHDDVFGQSTEDVDWLPQVGKRQWVLLTKDKRIRRNEAETTALMNAGVAAFVLTSGNLTGQQQGEAFAKALRRMQGMLRAHRVPFVATVTRDGGVEMFLDRRAPRRKEKI